RGACFSYISSLHDALPIFPNKLLQALIIDNSDGKIGSLRIPILIRLATTHIIQSKLDTIVENQYLFVKLKINFKNSKNIIVFTRTIACLTPIVYVKMLYFTSTLGATVHFVFIIKNEKIAKKYPQAIVAKYTRCAFSQLFIPLVIL